MWAKLRAQNGSSPGVPSLVGEARVDITIALEMGTMTSRSQVLWGPQKAVVTPQGVGQGRRPSYDLVATVAVEGNSRSSSKGAGVCKAVAPLREPQD
jgi:hypothetical protein